MKQRLAEILASEDLGVSGTKPITIEVTDPISRITLIHMPVGGSNDAVAHVAANIEKLELVDGSEVLYSLDGLCGQAVNIFEAKKPYKYFNYPVTGGTPLLVINMDFGRKLWDRELAFNPRKFVNPQIKLKWNEANWDASCSDHAFMIYAHVMEDLPAEPVGFLCNKEEKSFIGAAGGYEYTNLPVTKAIRKLIVQGYRKAYTTRNVLQEIRLDENGDKRVIIDGDIYNLRGVLDPLVGEVLEHFTVNATVGGRRYYCIAGQHYTVIGVADSAANACQITGIAGNTFVAASATATTTQNILAHGRDPHNCICLPFGDQDDLNDWYDMSGVEKLRLRTYGGGGAASGTTKILTQQLWRY